MTENDAALDLCTSSGGRAYIAEYFATQLRRHDFARYINNTLAADFACALAQHLSKLRAEGVQAGDERAACPTDVCQAGKSDGVLCANDECDRASGVRPASAPVADIRDELNSLGMFAHTALNLDERDMRNNMEDLADRLLALAGGAPVTNAPVAGEAVTSILDAKPLGPEFTKVLADNFENLMLRSDAAPQASEAVRLDDGEIETLVRGLGMRWEGSYWVCEDADLHPLARALLYRYTEAPKAKRPPPDVNAAMAAEYQQWINWFHKGRDYDSFLKECVLNKAQADKVGAQSPANRPESRASIESKCGALDGEDCAKGAADERHAWEADMIAAAARHLGGDCWEWDVPDFEFRLWQIAARRRRHAEDAKAWLDLFWSVAKELNCLPSSFVDGNEHVLRAARQARAALLAQKQGESK